MYRQHYDRRQDLTFRMYGKVFVPVEGILAVRYDRCIGGHKVGTDCHVLLTYGFDGVASLYKSIPINTDTLLIT